MVCQTQAPKTAHFSCASCCVIVDRVQCCPHCAGLVKLEALTDIDPASQWMFNTSFRQLYQAKIAQDRRNVEFDVALELARRTTLAELKLLAKEKFDQINMNKEKEGGLTAEEAAHLDQRILALKNSFKVSSDTTFRKSVSDMDFKATAQRLTDNSSRKRSMLKEVCLF